MKVHFADGDPSDDAVARALREEMDGWQPGRRAAWDEPRERAQRRTRRRAWTVAGATAGLAALAAVLLALLGVILDAAHVLPPGFDQFRARLLP